MDERTSTRWIVVAMIVAVLSSGATWFLVRRGPQPPAADGDAAADAAALRTAKELAAARAELARTRALLAPFEQEAQSRFGAEGTAELARVAAELARLPNPEAGTDAGERTPPVPRKREPVPGANTLKLSEQTVASVAEGLKAGFVFTPSTDVPLGELTLLVRVPRKGEAKIVGFAPQNPEAFEAGAGQRIGPDGSYVMFRGTPAGVQPLAFDLTVTAPVRATVGGSCGINLFETDIGAVATLAP